MQRRLTVEAAPARAVYIPEIQGLRTVAALLVAVYHIWFDRVSGGVDAFFVIAAFFMMTSFARKPVLGPGDVLAYYAATLRRVAPTTALVVVATVAGSILFMPTVLWYETMLHAAASTVFMENWWLAISGADYLRQDIAASPFQQMWALSVQVQYYALLPLVMLAVAVLARRTGSEMRRAFTMALAALFGVSLAYSIVMTERNQPFAYFDTFARGWEYMVGALLALHIDKAARLPAAAMRAMGYACLAVLMGFAAMLPVANLFPGYAAFIPVLATAGLIVAARSGAVIAPLRWGPVLALGDISFAFYLWHWPLLIFLRMRTGVESVGLVEGLAVIAAAGLLAAATVYLVETPFRRWRLLAPRPVLSLAMSGLILAPAAASVILWRADFRERDARARVDLAAVWAASDGSPPLAAPPVPAPVIARTDLPLANPDRCHQDLFDSALMTCSFGQAGGRGRVALVGGSHSLQWLPALRRLAGEMGFQVVTLTKSSCPFMVPGETLPGVRYPASCSAWNAAVLDWLAAERPDAVVTIATRGSGAEEAVPAAYRDVWAATTALGVPVLALRDNPWFARDVPTCVDFAGADPAACARPRETLLAATNPAADLAMDGVTVLDLSDLFCDADQCFAVRGDLLVYRDQHHITATFAHVHAGRLRPALAELLPPAD